MRKARCFSLGWAATVLAVFLVCAVAGPALAQTDVTKTRVTGSIKDIDGGALPGATVVVKSLDSGQVWQTVSDNRGSYRLVDLPSGTYEITVSLAGFATARRPDLRLVLGSSPTLDFTMQLAATQEAITVSSEVPMVEVSNTTTATTIQTEQLNALPLTGRDFLNMVLLTPETRRESERNGLSISGQRGINTNITVDGVDFNNPFFGGQAAGAEGRAPLSISQESIKEFSVITNGASVEFGRSGGGFVNVITKSGTNAFHGSAFYYSQPNAWVSPRADGSSLNDQTKSQYGASIGGPIFKDKLFFFTAYDGQTATEDILLNANVTDANAQNVFAKYPALTSQPGFTRGTDGRVVFARLDYQFAGSHRLTGRYNYTDYLGDNGSSSDTRNTTNYNGIEHMWARSTVLAYSGMFGSNWLNDANAQYFSEYTPREDKSPNLTDVRTSSPSIRWGGVYYLPIVSNVTRKNLTDSLTYLVGDHVFKGGFDYNDTNVTQTFKGDWRGVYQFANEADLIAGKWNQFYQFIGLNGITAAEAGTIDMTQKELAFFVQDQWYITPKLTTSLGVRWEKLDNPNGPVLNPYESNADGSFVRNGHIPDVTNQWSPRFGITWSPFKTNTVLRLSAGRFWSRTPALLFAQLYSSDGTRGARYTIRWNSKTQPNGPTDPLSPGWGDAFNPEDVAPLDYSQITTRFKGLDVYAVNPKFTNPYTDRLTLGFEHELFKDTGLSLDLTYAKGYQLQRLADFNLQYDIDSTTGQVKLSPINGMPMFSRTRPNSNYGKVIVNMADAYSEYYGAILTLQRRFTERVFGFLSVTYSKDKDDDSNERNYAGVQFEDVNNRANQWGYANRDMTWKWALNGVWNTPWWGISLSGVYRYTSGQPVNPTTYTDANNDTFYNDRPTIDGVHLARNSYRGPTYSSLDLRLQKDFRLGPGKLGILVQCFNCTNSANEQYPVSTWGDGQTPNSNFLSASPTNYTRTFQAALRYDF